MRILLACLWLAVSASARASSPLPEYRIGDAFIYDNGRVEQLLSASGDELTWSPFEGRKYVRDRNFVLPLLQWGSADSTGTRKISSEAGSLWPLEPGKAVRFRVVTDVTIQTENGTRKRPRRADLWSCRVLALAPITVPAGTFEAHEIRCEQFSSRTMRLLSEERWYYSEDVGHYISRNWIDFGTGRRGGYALTAKLTGRDANPRRIRSILSKL